MLVVASALLHDIARQQPEHPLAGAALLTRTLSEDEVVQTARTVLLQGEEPVTVEQIQEAIRQVAEKEPTDEEMRQVAARLASVGWPLAGPLEVAPARA